MKNTFLFSVIFMFFFLGACAQKSDFKGKTISFTAKDSVRVTADLYLLQDETAPIILLFHQAMYSRGEYREIAPKLNKLGYSCIAIDQRSGFTVNKVKNKTHKSAKKLGLGTKYPDAIPDLDAAIIYATTTLHKKKVILWGSSYSSALVFYEATKYPDNISGILSFSPGEYFEIEGQKIVSFAKKVKCPVFITSAKKEKHNWQPIYDQITSEKTSYLPTVKGKHGSKALWEENKGWQGYWEAVETFLDKIPK